jgi:hypothetical protein
VTMHIRLECAPSMREEIAGSDIWFPGCIELRQSITQATQVGDVALLRVLQSEHRRARLAFTGRTSHVKYEVPPSRPVAVLLTMPDLPPALDADEATRAVLCYPTTWQSWTPAQLDGEHVMYRFVRGSFADYLRPMPVVRLSVNHMPDLNNLGSWRWFGDDDHGLRGLVVFSNTPAGLECMGALDSGDAPGFSIHAEPMKVFERRRRLNGLRCFEVKRARLLEAGPVDRPWDEDAVAVDIGGRPPKWMLRRDAIERDDLLRRVLAHQPALLRS